MIEVGRIGLIDQGDDQGQQVRVLDDSANTGGYLIITGKKLSNPNAETFDSWVGSLSELQGFFEESGWLIKWL